MVGLFLSLFSGVLLSGAFAPLSLWWLAPIAISLHMFSLSRSLQPVRNVFLFAFVFNAIALHWTSIYVGSIPWIILCLGQSLLFLPLAQVKRYGIGFYPLIFLICEELRLRFPFGGFGWLRIAFSQADAPYRDIAAYAGASALTASVLLISSAIFSIMKGRLRFRFAPMLLPLALLLIPFQVQKSGSVSMLLIQGDVPQLGLDFNSRATAVFYKHVLESKRGLREHKDVDILVWPENAVDVDPFTNKSVGAVLDGFNRPIILGAVIRSNGSLQNTSILWRKNKQEIYVKNHLTPFGEYIPLRWLASKVSPFVDNVEDFSPGNQSKVFTINSARIAPIICYELIDDHLVAQAAKNSNVLIVQTNSATFGRSSESAQQLAITRIRAIEHGRMIASVSTTGISATIDNHGNILKATPMHTPAHIFLRTPLISSLTPSDKAGNWALLAVLIWMALLGMATRPVSKYRR